MKYLKWVGIAIGAVFALFILSGIALYFALKPYLASDSFRQLLESEVSKQLEVEVQFEPLQWNGLSVFTNSLKTIGASKVSIKTLDAEQLRISIALRPLLHHVARIDSIEMQSLEMEFQVPEPQPETPSTPEKATPTPPPGWIQSIAPTKVEIGEINIQQGKLRWPSGENTSGQLSQFKVQASVDGDDFNLWVREGKLELPQFPELQLQTLKGRAHQKTIFITTALLQYEKQGTFTVDGELGFNAPNTAHLNFELNNIPITPFLPGDWKARLIGNINGKFKLEQGEQTNGLPQVTGNIEMTQGKIEALPVFNEIAKQTGVEKWKSLPLDVAKSKLSWNPQKTTLDQMEFESKKYLIFKGDIQIEGENISGNTIIGTTPDLLKPFPTVLDQVFNQPLGEYATATDVISGTIHDIKDDLRDRVIAAALSDLLQKLPPGVGEKIQNITNEIQKKVPGLFDLLKGK
ncbi:MAG: hypothetical protein V4507_01825 [Verrucomicrobiota bacterium]